MILSAIGIGTAIEYLPAEVRGLSSDALQNWDAAHVNLFKPVSEWGPGEYADAGVISFWASASVAFLAFIVEVHAQEKQGKIQQPRYLGDGD